MLSTLGPEGAATLHEHPERLLEVNRDVEAMGVTVVEQYALLGRYDFLNVIDAPDETTVAKLAMTLAARGTLKTVTMPAIPVAHPRSNRLRTSTRVPGVSRSCRSTSRSMSLAIETPKISPHRQDRSPCFAIIQGTYGRPPQGQKRVFHPPFT
jgi:uncharacterized protein with GYD domain